MNKKKNTEERNKGEKSKTSSQNMCGKTETCPLDERILAVHVAFNCSNIRIVINAQYTKYVASDEFVLISSNIWQFEQGGSWWVRNLWLSLREDCHLLREDVMHLLQSLMTKRNGWSYNHRVSCELQTKILYRTSRWA